MDKGTQEDKVSDWDEMYEKTRDKLLKDIGMLETIQARRQSSVPFEREIGTTYSWIQGSFMHIQALLEVANAHRQRLLLIEHEVQKTNKMLQSLKKEISEYKPFLEYIKKFAEDRQREEREKEKWK